MHGKIIRILKGKNFTILEFMEWYSKKYGNGLFTYPIDWKGFNIPGKIIKEVIEGSNGIVKISDPNKYDSTMWEIYCDCKNPNTWNGFYLIGMLDNIEMGTFNHELAHAFYYINSSYKKEMDQLIKEMDPLKKEIQFKRFKKLGYHKSVFYDELQAYSVGNSKNKKFVNVFKKYLK